MSEQFDIFQDLVEPQRVEYKLPNAKITLIERFFNKAESEELYSVLYKNINWVQNAITIYGKSHLIPRLNAWYADNERHYCYSGVNLKPNSWSHELLGIKKRVEEVTGISFNSCLANLYRNGQDGVGWHQDNEKILGDNPPIASISFGQKRIFQLKHIYRKDLSRVDIPLTDGSFLLMMGTTQHYWKHQIPKSTKSLAPRLNLTFRVLQ